MQNQGNMFCPNCGGQNTADNNFCLYCGNSLTNLNQQNNQYNQQQFQQTQQYNQYNQQQTQQYNQYNQQQTQQYNQQQNNQYNKQQAMPQKKKKFQKLGFLGWVGIIALGYSSLGSIYSLIFAGALAVLYFTTPNSKHVINIILRVIGAINITLLALGLILVGACFGIIGAGA